MTDVSHLSNYIIVDRVLWGLDGPLQLDLDGAEAHLCLPETLQEDVEGTAWLEVERVGHVDLGQLEHQGQKYQLTSDLNAVYRLVPFERGDLHLFGVQGIWVTPPGGRIVREVQILIAAADRERGERLCRAFMRERPAEVLSLLRWTLPRAMRYVAKSLAALDVRSQIEVMGPGVVELRRSGISRRLDIGQLFASHDLGQANMSDGQAQLDSFLAAALTAPLPAKRGAVLARILGRDEVPDGSPRATLAIGDGLVMAYVHDMPDALRYLDAEEVSALEPNEEVRLALVKRNLWQTIPPIRIAGRPIFMALCGGYYEASLVLLKEFWDFVLPLLDGPPLVAVVSRDLLFVTGDVGAARRDKVRALAAPGGKPAWAISDGLYRRRDDGWLERVDTL